MTFPYFDELSNVYSKIIFIFKWQQNKKKVSKKVLFSLMARPLEGGGPLNGLAISGGTFFLRLPLEGNINILERGSIPNLLVAYILKR